MAGDGMVTVHVTLFDHPIEVHESEIPGLRAQGLLVEDEKAATPAQPQQPAAPAPKLPAPAPGQPSA